MMGCANRLREHRVTRAQVGAAKLEHVSHVLALLLEALLTPRVALLRHNNSGQWSSISRNQWS